MSINSAVRLALDVLKEWGQSELHQCQILICEARSFWNIVKILEEHGIETV